jgi:hypothetical protein
MRYQRIEHEDYIEEIYDPHAQQTDGPGPWPILEPAAQHGLGGKILFWLAPDTEADFAALLLQFLVSFGNAVGRKPYYLVEGTKHYPNLFTVLAGQTAKARKGTSADRIRQLFAVSIRNGRRIAYRAASARAKVSCGQSATRFTA